MVLNMYSVFDSKMAVFGRPWYAIRDAEAIRSFSDAVNDGSNPNNQWHKHPEDFQLFMVGRFDDELGQLEPRAPVALVSAASLFNSLSNGKAPVFTPEAAEETPVN